MFNTRQNWLNDHHRDVLFPIILFSAIYLKWRELHLVPESETVYLMANYAPYTYRLTSYLFIFLGTVGPFSLYTFLAISYFAVILCCYLILSPTFTEKGFLLFCAWVCLTPVFWNVIQLLVLILLVIKASDVKFHTLLIPLTLIKELAAWQGFWFLVLDKQLTLRTILIACIAGVSYLIVRLVIIGNHSYYPGVGFFTPLGILAKVQTEPLWMIERLFVKAIPLFFLLCLTIQSRTDGYLCLLNAIPVCLFALVWEIQLWLPIAIILFTTKKKEIR